jgi:hypothetical protein
MEYFDSPARKTGGLCSDPECPCDETSIPVGQGNLWISRELCDFRWDCRTMDELDKKIERLEQESRSMIMLGPGVADPILMCEFGARKRKLDFEISQEDAKRWWATGQVPFRPTPRAGEPERAFSKQTSQTQGGCFIATAACGSSLEPEVLALREFRERTVRPRPLGRTLIHVYERLSPPIARWIETRPVARCLVRLLVVRPCVVICRRLAAQERLPLN